MRIRFNILMVVILFAGLLSIQLFFIFKTWDHTANKFEIELDLILEDVHDFASTDSTFNDLLRKAILQKDQNALHELEAQLSTFEKSEFFNSGDLSFEVFANRFSGDSSDFLLQNVDYNKENFTFLKNHHFCLTCVMENSYVNRTGYLELGAAFNNKAKLQLEELWLPILLSFLFLVLLSVFSIVVLRKWASAQQLNIQKNGFINNLSHELKTPIFSIKLFSQLIIEKSDDQNLNEYGGRIKMEANHLEKQIHRILESTGLESGHLIRPARIELNSFLSEMIPSIKLLCEHHNCDFNFTSSRSSDCNISADEIHLKNVINVLIDNAIKYGKGKAKVNLDLISESGYYFIHVSDNGIGIPDKEKRHVTEKFFRVNMSDNNSIAGFGLGLFYANEATKQMNGSLEVLDNNPEGTIIKLRFKSEE